MWYRYAKHGIPLDDFEEVINTFKEFLVQIQPYTKYARTFIKNGISTSKHLKSKDTKEYKKQKNSSIAAAYHYLLNCIEDFLPHIIYTSKTFPVQIKFVTGGEGSYDTIDNDANGLLHHIELPLNYLLYDQKLLFSYFIHELTHAAHTELTEHKYIDYSETHDIETMPENFYNRYKPYKDWRYDEIGYVNNITELYAVANEIYDYLKDIFTPNMSNEQFMDMLNKSHIFKARIKYLSPKNKREFLTVLYNKFFNP